MDRIILASSSPRRKYLLEQANIPFEIVVHEVDETFRPELDMKAAVTEVALRKAMAVKDVVARDQIILAADTIVVLNEKLIGKPKGREDAINILTQLQNTTHQVITGVALLKGNTKQLFAEVTEVVFHPLTPRDIVYYIDTYKPYDKAGAYAIQEWIGLIGIKAIIGDFYNVMGLPVSRVLQEIHQLQHPFSVAE